MSRYFETDMEAPIGTPPWAMDSPCDNCQLIHDMRNEIDELREWLGAAFEYIDQLERDLAIPEPKRWDIERFKEELNMV